MSKKYIFFWGYENDYPEFSQWHLSDFKIASARFSDKENPILKSLIEHTYNCAEQYMMSEKARLFGDKEIYEKIMYEPSPAKQKRYGKKVANFDVSIWRQKCEDVVYRGNVAKFSQNEELKKLLLDTGDAIIVEASPYDKIWGIGLHPDDVRVHDENNWRGENLLGKALMRTRQYLKEVSQ